MPDWSATPYVRVYLTLADDHPRIWNDLALLGAWLVTLVEADRYWPTSAPLPDVPEPQWERLLTEGVVEEVGSTRYRFHGLDAHRESLARRGELGGRARAAAARRDRRGRMVAGESLVKVAGGNAGDPNATAGETLVGVAGALAGEDDPQTPAKTRWSNAGAPANQRHDTTRLENPESPRRVVSSPAPAPAREAAPPTIRCDDYLGHQLTGHRQIAGVGWKCLICEKVAAENGPRLRDIVPFPGDEDRPW